MPRLACRCTRFKPPCEACAQPSRALPKSQRFGVGQSAEQLSMRRLLSPAVCLLRSRPISGAAQLVWLQAFGEVLRCRGDTRIREQLRNCAIDLGSSGS